MSETGSAAWHEPVMLGEVLSCLRPEGGKLILDATVGTCGHAEGILVRGGRLVGLDRDP
ncbi:MAG TPA: 16S rRNA (cytosine(1402)-N(4))-methyltransferase, partial [Candidatus Acetothermia bacterium]|nr:16S rRNA (cytosine(1402)-N(4))-methyltransferase [Candidatus Acetothermia bacterium]